MGNDLLLEIGTEEIPAAFLPRALKDLRAMCLERLTSLRLEPGSVVVMGTPRRLSMRVHGLPEAQGDLVQEVTGPPRSVALDTEGNPTRALEKFCARYGADTGDVSFVTKEKGEFVCLKKVDKGRQTEDLLQDLLPEWILALSFPKAMRWGTLDIRFARPIRWILCLYKDAPLRFSVGDVESSSTTYGHRFMSDGGAVDIRDIDAYPGRLRDTFVVLDPEERREIILRETRALAEEVAGRIEEDEAFLDTLVYLTEYPLAVRGAFDEAFLSLPEEVMAASMKHHLKYYPVRKQQGSGLLPYFIAVSNTAATDMEKIRTGMERVLKARLVDARFFFDEDTRKPLAENLEALRHVIFHKKLGTAYDKVQRVRTQAEGLAEMILPDALPRMRRAAELCKADLVTQMVGEFPELQGIMGGIYAAHGGEAPEVARAIGEHYKPVSAEGDLPETDLGALLSLADKMDTVVAFFSIGTPVSGNRDPFGVRRRVLGILRILLDRQMELPLSGWVDASIKTLEARGGKPDEEILREVIEFFRQRYTHHLLAKGFPHDTIDAVLARPFQDVVDLYRRIDILHRMRSNEDFEKLILGCKRAVNLLGQAEKQFGYQGPDAPLSLEDLKEEAERDLFSAVERERDRIHSWMAQRDYASVLQGLVNLKDPIDRLFDDVMVLVDDPQLRKNRLSLLHNVAGLFEGFADFSKMIF